MTRELIEREVEGVRFRLSIRRPVMGEPIVRYLVMRSALGRDFWTTIAKSDHKLLPKAKTIFARDLTQCRAV